MGNSQSIPKINFEDVQMASKHPELYLLINTLAIYEQDCLIINSIHASQEEVVINKHLKLKNNVPIIIYGKNSNDDALYRKYQQLLQLGFSNVYLYLGGLFEWLLLQDIYGAIDFPTTSQQLDILKYKPNQRLHVGLIDYK
uniref:Rhodanese domain-containing protein n=1 Tax=viral metagenome TaxID=1070528 RepID=A0A6C0BAL1_9ZZZZ